MNKSLRNNAFDLNLSIYKQIVIKKEVGFDYANNLFQLYVTLVHD